MPGPGRPFILAIAGGSASGKTTLARHVASRLAPLAVAMVPEDAYYFSVPGGAQDDGAPYNFDRPETKDFALLRRHLVEARGGASFAMPVYDFRTHTRQAHTVSVAAADVLIVEGIHNLHDADLRALFDLTVFVEAPKAVRETRRVARDVAERGRDAGATRRQFRAVVEPMHRLHVDPLRVHAHRIVRNIGDPQALQAAADELAMNIRSTVGREL